MASVLLELPGAVEGRAPDAGVAWHYGDPSGEQRETVTSAGWVDRSNREVLTVSGEDRLTFLHTLLSQHLSELAAQQPTEALLLDANGRVENHLQLVDDGERTWIHVEPGHAQPLLDYFQRMIFWSKVTIEPVDVAVLSVLGPDTAAVITAAEAPTLVPHATPPLPVAGSPTGSLIARRVDLLIPRAELAGAAARLSAAGARPLGSWGYEALRVADRVPRLGQETDDKTIPHEVGWIGSAVHLAKGCYRGQETVARVHNLGRPPRRLVLLHLDGSDAALPVHGEPLLLADTQQTDPQGSVRPIGWIGTAARHWELGPIALAVVKRQVPDEAALMVGLPADRPPVPASIDPAVSAA